MTKAKKFGKDVVGGKGSVIIQTAKDREEYEEYKRRKAEEQEEEEEKKKLGTEKMPEEREPRPEGLSLEEFAEMKVLAKHKKLRVKKVVLKEEE